MMKITTGIVSIGLLGLVFLVWSQVEIEVKTVHASEAESATVAYKKEAANLTETEEAAAPPKDAQRTTDTTEPRPVTMAQLEARNATKRSSKKDTKREEEAPTPILTSESFKAEESNQELTDDTGDNKKDTKSEEAPTPIASSESAPKAEGSNEELNKDNYVAQLEAIDSKATKRPSKKDTKREAVPTRIPTSESTPKAEESNEQLNTDNYVSQLEAIHNDNDNTGNGGGGLWIHNIGFEEGMSAWRNSVKQMLMIAKAFNATFVEPCVKRGRLMSCANLPTSSVRLGDVCDVTVLKQFHPKIASFEEFQTATGYNKTCKGDNVVLACLAHRKTCQMGPTQLRSTCKKADQPAIDQAIRDSQTKPSPVILEIGSIRVVCIGNYIQSTPQVAQYANAGDAMVARLPFAPHHYEEVASMLETSLNIPRGAKFAAIQWRPETIEDLNYTACANALLQSRDHISQRDGIPKENFILLSPLSLVHELQWGGVAHLADRHNDTSYPSLQRLFDHGFHKMEQIPGVAIADGINLVVWDYIVAQTATTFSQCTKSKNTCQLCSKCNYSGRAGGLVYGLRQKYTGGRGKSDQCWPGVTSASGLEV